MFHPVAFSIQMAMLAAVVLPAAIVAFLSAAVTFVLMQGAKEFLRIFHIDLSGSVAGISAAVVALLVSALNGLLGQIPPAFEPLAAELLNLIALLLGLFGPFAIYRAYREFRDRGLPDSSKK